jgi:hypothetical protein
MVVLRALHEIRKTFILSKDSFAPCPRLQPISEQA